MDINTFYTKNGLLYSKDPEVKGMDITTIVGDSIAREFDFVYVEHLIRFLELKQDFGKDDWGNLLRTGNDDNRLWNTFCSWAMENSIGSNEVDYKEWWEAYYSGATAWKKIIN